MSKTIDNYEPGAIAPADGNVAGNSKYETRNSSDAESNFDFRVLEDKSRSPIGTVATPESRDLGSNNERLQDVKPHLVNALSALVLQYPQEGVVARRHEIQR